MYLIIQNGFVNPHITKYLHDKWQIIKSYEANFHGIDPSDYNLIIILGGYQSLTMIYCYTYLIKLVGFIEKCIKLNIPILGICLGAQLIAYTLGCKIITSDKLFMGYDVKLLGEYPIFRNHHDYIVANSNIDVIEWVDSMPYYFTHGKHVIGVQAHPDIDPDSLDNFVNDVNLLEKAKNIRENVNKSNQIIIDTLIKLLTDSTNNLDSIDQTE